MKTKERILKISLEEFNRLGAPNVSTIDISETLDISPGNLYYYFKNKEDIIQTHFTELSQYIKKSLNHIAFGLLNLDQLSTQVTFILHQVHTYRYIFHDIHSLAGTTPTIGQKYRTLIQQTTESFTHLLKSYANHDLLITGLQQQINNISEQLAFTLYKLPIYDRDLNMSLKNDTEAFHELVSKETIQTLSLIPLHTHS